MWQKLSKQMAHEDLTRADHLLKTLAIYSQREPSPAVRERLSVLAAQRLGKNPGNAVHKEEDRNAWLKPILAALLLVAVGIAATAVFRIWLRDSVRSRDALNLQQPANSQHAGASIVPVTSRLASGQRKARSVRHSGKGHETRQMMTMQLPYSNRAIGTGTDTVLQVSMTESELRSLGFPLNSTVRDRRLVAQLTIGDDGLPRAISLPLPLEVVKEKR